jgi:hypothetical protein
LLATLFLVAFLVATLYIGREIFIPIAIAILVSFVLSPPILLLRRWGLGRVPSVLTVVFTALVIAFSVSAVLTRQVSELAVDLPLYQATINAKLDDLRAAAADNALFAKVSAALKKLGEIKPHRPARPSAPTATGILLKDVRVIHCSTIRAKARLVLERLCSAAWLRLGRRPWLESSGSREWPRWPSRCWRRSEGRWRWSRW